MKDINKFFNDFYSSFKQTVKNQVIVEGVLLISTLNIPLAFFLHFRTTKI